MPARHRNSVSHDEEKFLFFSDRELSLGLPRLGLLFVLQAACLSPM